jgi:HK97 gp10 family phage protein
MASTVTFIPNPGLEEEWERSHEARDPMDEIGEAVVEEARRIAPVDTGDLAASIHAVEETVDGGPGVAIVADVSYAAFVELGTSDTPAQPYLRPALERVRD